MHAHGMLPIMPRKPSLWLPEAVLMKLHHTALSDLDNADRVDPGSLPSGMKSILGHVHTYQSAVVKMNMDLAYYTSLLKSLPVFMATDSMKDRFQTSVTMQAK